MKMKKFFANLLSVLLIGTLILSGCGTGGEIAQNAQNGNSQKTAVDEKGDKEEQKDKDEDEDRTEDDTDTEDSDDKEDDVEDKEDKEDKESDDKDSDDGKESEDSEGEDDDSSDLSGADEEIPDGTPFEIHGALSVEGTTLVDEKGNIVALRGVSTHGLQWFPEYANKDAYEQMRDEWGVNVIRLAMYTGESGYCDRDAKGKKELKDLIIDSVEACSDLGLYVIVDWHILSDNTPKAHEDEALLFFDEMSDEFSDLDNVIYEICNEPNNGADWKTIKDYAENVIPVIRENDDNAIIVVGTPTWSQDVDKAADNPISGYDNIMYALHFYADTHRDDLRKKMEVAIKDGLPIFVTEFGACDASGGGQINEEQSNIWMDLLVKYNVSSCIWNLSNKNETSALIKSDVSKTSGFKYSDLTKSGKWFVDWMVENAGAIGSGKGGTLKEGSDEEDEEEDSESKGPEFITVETSKGNIVAKAEIVNTWEADGDTFCQCNIYITNNGSKTVKDWKISIMGDEELEISQNWCCSVSEKDGKLVITPESYNKEIAADETKKDIGIIFSSHLPVRGLMVLID